MMANSVCCKANPRRVKTIKWNTLIEDILLRLDCIEIVPLPRSSVSKSTVKSWETVFSKQNTFNLVRYRVMRLIDHVSLQRNRHLRYPL